MRTTAWMCASVVALGLAAMQAAAPGQGGGVQNAGAVTLDGDDLVDQLLAVGAAGGHVSGVRRTDAGPVISAWYPDGD